MFYFRVGRPDCLAVCCLLLVSFVECEIVFNPTYCTSKCSSHAFHAIWLCFLFFNVVSSLSHNCCQTLPEKLLSEHISEQTCMDWCEHKFPLCWSWPSARWHQREPCSAPRCAFSSFLYHLVTDSYTLAKAILAFHVRCSIFYDGPEASSNQAAAVTCWKMVSFTHPLFTEHIITLLGSSFCRPGEFKP